MFGQRTNVEFHRTLRADFYNITKELESFKAHMRANPDEERVTITPGEYLALMEYKRDSLKAFAKTLHIPLP